MPYGKVSHRSNEMLLKGAKKNKHLDTLCKLDECSKPFRLQTK